MAEHLSPVFQSETARHFLFEFGQLSAPFGLVGLKRYLKILHKVQPRRFVTLQPIQEIFGRALFGLPPLTWQVLPFSGTSAEEQIKLLNLGDFYQ